MYSAVPVIISDNKIFKEIGGQYAYYFKKNNIESLIRQIKKVWNESAERTIRIEKSLQYVTKFDKKKQAKKIIELYHELMK